MQRIMLSTVKRLLKQQLCLHVHERPKCIRKNTKYLYMCIWHQLPTKTKDATFGPGSVMTMKMLTAPCHSQCGGLKRRPKKKDSIKDGCSDVTHWLQSPVMRSRRHLRALEACFGTPDVGREDLSYRSSLHDGA